jgi:hypothetical protein
MVELAAPIAHELDKPFRLRTKFAAWFPASKEIQWYSS